jgi:diguanylate cyclase (GGDEF)-like protein
LGSGIRFRRKTGLNCAKFGSYYKSATGLNKDAGVRFRGCLRTPRRSLQIRFSAPCAVVYRQQAARAGCFARGKDAMRVRGSKPADLVAPKVRGGRVPSVATSAAASPGPAARVVLAGIPEPELTPAVREALMKLLAEVQELRQQLRDSQARIAFLERLADEDALTPIANRRAFVRELTRTVAFSQRYRSPASVVYFDVNGMKQINDVHGHAAGDATLMHVSKVLLDNIRSSDIVGRLGGDEFGVILAQANEQQANQKAAALARAIAETPLRWNSTEIGVTAAFGVHSFVGEDDAQQAMDAADRAMYRQKRRARAG